MVIILRTVSLWTQKTGMWQTNYDSPSTHLNYVTLYYILVKNLFFWLLSPVNLWYFLSVTYRKSRLKPNAVPTIIDAPNPPPRLTSSRVLPPRHPLPEKAEKAAVDTDETFQNGKYKPN